MTAEDQPGEWDVEAERNNILTLLSEVVPGESPRTYIGTVPPDHDQVMFGGCVIGQSITALCKEAPEGARLHSFHGYFLRPATGAKPMTHVVETIRDGRAFAQRRSTVSQAGKEVFTAMASFTSDGEGYLYDLPHTSELPPRPAEPDGFGLAGFEASFLGPTEQRSDGTYESTERKWFRLPADIGDDVHLHTAYIGLASDWTGMGSMPLNMAWEWEEGQGPPVASLDHSLWVHRPPRITDWLFLDLHSVVNYGTRGTLRGTIRNESGELVASFAQELLLR